MKQLWAQNPSLQGQNVGVAILDSGVIAHPDLRDAAGASRITAAIPVLDNLVLNGGFEDGIIQWTPFDSQRAGVSTSDAAFGDAALKLVRRAQNGSPASMVQPINSYIPGETYMLSVRAKRAGAGCDDSGGVWVGVRGVTSSETWSVGTSVCSLSYEQKIVRFTVPQDTSSSYIFAFNNSLNNDFLLDDISITPVRLSATQASSVLISSASLQGSQIDLSSEGGLDWRVWNGTSAARRSGVPARIAFQPYSAQGIGTFSNAGTTYSWSGGTPTAGGTSTTGVSFMGSSNGFTITVPATTSYRTLRVYMTLQSTKLSSTSFLNDGSSLPQVDTSVNTSEAPGEQRRVVYTYTFKSDTDARQLTVQLMNAADQGPNAMLALHAVTLSEGTSIPVSTMTTVADGNDQYGHGTLIAGLIGGDGRSSFGQVMGVAPRTNLVSVRVLNADGEATVSDVIRGMEWIYKNRTRYNIRVLNMSLNSTVPESYHTSPLSAAAEILWMNGIVVVVSAGNTGSATQVLPPANDPFVITVGATDDLGTASTIDDRIASFSARGTTEAGTVKPEIFAPGVNLTSLLCSGCYFAKNYPNNISTGRFKGGENYFRASGTSLSSAVVAGAAALVIQQNPRLTPDQVKYRLMTTGTSQFGSTKPVTLNVYAAVNGTSTQSANTGLPVSKMLFTGAEALTSDSARWGSARWGSARWGSARWGSTATASSLRSSVTGMARWGSGPSKDSVAPPPEDE